MNIYNFLNTFYKSESGTYFANMLLSKDFPMGRMSTPTRKKGDWFHSIAIFCNQNISELPVKGKMIKCTIIHFYGSSGTPVLSLCEAHIKCSSIHKGKKVYSIDLWDDSFAVIGDIKTNNGYEIGHGSSTIVINDIIDIAFNKWGYEQIPYTHQKRESYNCVAFVDDILHICKYHTWNPRIFDMHSKYQL